MIKPKTYAGAWRSSPRLSPLRALLSFLALLLLIQPASAFGAVTDNGSTVCDSNRDALAAIDANWTLTSSTQLIIYAAGMNDDGCRAQDGEGGITLQYRVLGGSFANVPTSSGSVP